MTASAAGRRRASAVVAPTKAWRITTAPRAPSALDGEGARRFGGRWNPAGLAMVYTAQHFSLAVLELLVHVDTDLVPEDLVAVPVILPSGARVETVLAADLPAEWRQSPAPDELAAIGAAWVERGATLALSVPSAVVPEERNLLINPAHADAGRLRAGAPLPFALDGRLIG